MGNCMRKPKSRGGRERVGDAVDGQAASRSCEVEQDLLKNKVMTTGRVSEGIIASLKGAHIRAIAPLDFKPETSAIKGVINALKGNTGRISSGFQLNASLPKYYPGKSEVGKFMIATDGAAYGCVAYKSQECVVLLCCSNADLETVATLAREASEHLIENGL